jgi:hypothetical protein
MELDEWCRDPFASDAGGQFRSAGLVNLREQHKAHQLEDPDCVSPSWLAGFEQAFVCGQALRFPALSPVVRGLVGVTGAQPFDPSSSWLELLLDPFSRYLSGAGATSAAPLMNVLSARVLGVHDAAQAWARLRGSWADPPDVQPPPRDHMVNFAIHGVTDVRDGPVLFFPRPDEPGPDPNDP